MNLVLETESPTGIGARQHLADQLRAALHSGQIPTGDALPSSRTLAAAVNVSRGTVISVYEDLAGEGYLDIQPGSGTFAAGDFSAFPHRLFPPRPSPSQSPNAVSKDRAPVDSTPEPGRSAEAINLWPGSPSSGFQHSRDWKAAWRSALAQEIPAVPPDPAGQPETRQLISEHLAVSRGIICHADQIVITAGTSDGLGLLTQALMGSRSAPLQVATENPGYPAARRVLSRCGAITVPIPLRDGGMDSAALASTPGTFAAALLTPSHQYPLGGRLSVTARLAILEWAETEDAILIEDDYDSEFRHGAPALPSITSLDNTGRVVHLGSYSKTLTPWLRCGYLLIPDEKLRTEVLTVRDDLGEPVSGIVQSALAQFMDSGGLRRHLVRVGREYAHRRALVLAAAEPLEPQIRLDAIEGGLHAVLSWDHKYPTKEIVAELMKSSIRVAPLPTYYHPDSTDRRDGIVFGYGGPTDLQLRTALARITAVLQN